MKAIKLGAYDYLTRPIDNERIKIVIKNALKTQLLNRKVTDLQEQLGEKFKFSNIIGNSSQTQKVYQLVKRAAPYDITVLLQGETGTGKELKGFSPEAIKMLLKYQWPGNVRELKNTVKSAVLLADDIILPEHLLLNMQKMNDELGVNWSIELQKDLSLKKMSKTITQKVERELIVDTVIPCGLIVNELVSNSLKHAFPAGREGEICIKTRSDNDKSTLIVSDNGVGFPKDLDFRNTKTLGLQLVCTLVDQLGGSIELDRSGGTEFKITFTKVKYEERD